MIRRYVVGRWWYRTVVWDGGGGRAIESFPGTPPSLLLLITLLKEGERRERALCKLVGFLSRYRNELHEEWADTLFSSPLLWLYCTGGLILSEAELTLLYRSRCMVYVGVMHLSLIILASIRDVLNVVQPWYCMYTVHGHIWMVHG